MLRMIGRELTYVWGGTPFKHDINKAGARSAMGRKLEFVSHAKETQNKLITNYVCTEI
jgi:hypothetical protein